MLLRLFALIWASLFTLTQSEPFEPPNFNVIDALRERGIAVQDALFEGAILGEEGSSSAGCSVACTTLDFLYGSQNVHFQDSDAYASFTTSFWSLQQASVRPHCIFTPTNATQVSALVLLSRWSKCPFAAKSGGHAAFAGASSIDGGITISFEKMAGIALSEDRSIASIEPGNTWSRVYSTLAESDLAVVGGRVFNIGVGGLTLGGGISFLSGQNGWACDNVQRYEVVTASGALVNATADENPDLYWALRGGGNNFGLVVKFHLTAYPLQGSRIWGSTRVYTEDAFPAVVDAFSDLVVRAPEDPQAGQWVAWLSHGGHKIASTELWYPTPIASVPIFSAYEAIPAVQVTTENRTLYEYTERQEEFNVNGLREIYYVVTMKADRALADAAKDIFFEEIPAVANVTGVLPGLIYHGITTPQLERMAERGGNALGITAEEGPYYLMHVCCWWADAADDTKVYEMASTVLKRIKAKSVEEGKENAFLYMNYASQFQDVIASYGEDNKARLLQVAAKYDPMKVFQILQPGGFKLEGGPPVKEGGYFAG